MINAVDATIKQLVTRELGKTFSDLTVSFSPPTGDWTSRLGNTRALNFFLYDVRENAQLRHHQWQPARQNPGGDPRRANRVQLKRTPLLLDCHYMVTAWSPAEERFKAIDEHELLSAALMALARYPVLNPRFARVERIAAFAEVDRNDPEAKTMVALEARTHGHMMTEATADDRIWLNDEECNPLRRIETEVRTRLAQHDVLTNPSELWSALDAQMKGGFSYVVTLPLEPWDTVEAYRITEAHFRFDEPARNPSTGRLERIDPIQAEVLLTVRGVIRNGDGAPLASRPLTLLHDKPDIPAAHTRDDVATDRFTTRTNDAGEYVFAHLRPGDYSLQITSPDDTITVRELRVLQSGPTGYDFTV